MRVRLFVDHEDAPRLNQKKVDSLVRCIVREEEKKSEYINVILVNDMYMLDVNRKFLNHNYRTDVISFNLGESGPIEGEVYVSVDRAKVQARRYKVSLEREVLRLIVHGVLHLTGWDDKTRSQKLQMRKRENRIIEQFDVRQSKP